MRLPLPEPIPHDRPVPSAAQLAWQREELAMFCHLGPNTFTDREWGDGTEDPAVFSPDALDADQWATTARDAGFGTVVLTAKHHDGFCLWPTATTRHSVASSPWRGGSGDVVGEVARACRDAGVRLGIYCSPWDQNAPSYGSGRAYDDLWTAQLTELLTRYGDVAQVWFDGAVGPSAVGRQRYDWERVHARVRELQPHAVIFSDAGPDVRWVGNEAGEAGWTTWSTVHPDRVPVPGSNDPWTIESLRHGDPDGTAWRPPETDVSIRPGWFWHPGERPRDGAALLDLYLSSVGRGSKLLLNVPPDRHGRLDAADVAALHDLARLRGALLTDLAADGTATTRPDGVEVRLPAPVTFDVVGLAEDVEHGQHVGAFRVQAGDGEGWRTVASGTTIGHRRLLRVPPTTADRVRVLLDHAYGPPRLLELGLHADPRVHDGVRPDDHSA